MEMPGLNRLSTAIRTSRVSREYGIDALIERLEAYLPEDEIERVRRAYAFGQRMHTGQYRKSGEPYIYHPLAVARLLADMRLDVTTLLAAILHDVIEDTPTAKEEVAEKFGKEVAALVDGVSKLDRVQFQSRAEFQAENFRKLLLAMTDDIRVILVKLADRLHNMRTLDSVSAEQRRRVSRETLDIYAPIAQRLGINTIRVELEDLGFKNLYPKRHRVLHRASRQTTGNRKNLIREVEDRLSNALLEEGIGAAVVGRRKNLYSIYLKMRAKHLRFLDVQDLYGFRIMVDTVDNCYRAMGIVHHCYRPISDQFNDFIANPKVNGYQSLHTTVVGPGGIKIEVQIRTREMHQIAEAGVAAHWQYKLGDEPQGKAPQVRAREWLSNLADISLKERDALNFIENVKVDLFPDEVYVFTPKGQIRRLPRGATCVDFAYAVHTDLGNQCVAARIDHHLAPLSATLENGQTVEIITARHARPNVAWLNFVRTAKARAGIRGYLKDLKADKAERLGKRLLEKSLKELRVSTRRLRHPDTQEVLAQLGEEDLGALYKSIGFGRRMAPLVARLFLPEDQKKPKPSKQPLAVEGTEGLVVEYGRCCYPVPGDTIHGQMSAGRGLVIHRRGCKLSARRKATPGERIDLVWSDKVKGDFKVELRVQARNQRGVLARLTAKIAAAGCNIDSVDLPDRSGAIASMRFLIGVKDRKHLARVMRRLRRLPAVERAARA